MIPLDDNRCTVRRSTNWAGMPDMRALDSRTGPGGQSAAQAAIPVSDFDPEQRAQNPRASGDKKVRARQTAQAAGLLITLLSMVG